MPNDECQMTKEIRNPNVEGRSGLRLSVLSFGFRYSFGFEKCGSGEAPHAILDVPWDSESAWRWDFFERLAAIPFHGVAHRRPGNVQISETAPADVVMFVRRKSDTPVFRSSPINQADVFVRVGDAMNVQEPRGDQSASAGLGRRRTFAEQLDLEAAFLLRLAQ